MSEEMMCGGTAAAREPSSDEIELVKQMKTEVEKQTGKTYSIFEPVSIRTQPVAGINYFVKVRVGDDEFLHVRIFRDIQQKTHLHGVKQDLKDHDKLEYF